MRIFRKILLSLFLLLLLLIGGIWASIHYYGDDIKTFVINSINQQIRTKVDVKVVDISFWKNFPQTAVVFRETVIYSVDSETDTLLYAQNISTSFNLLELYKGNYQLKGLQIENGFCRMIRYNSGKTNYTFWEEQNDSSITNFSIDLQKVQLSKIQYEYTDHSNVVSIAFLIDETELSGNFKKDIFDLQIKSTFKNSFIKNADFVFVKDKTLFLYTNAIVNSQESSISFKDANLGIEGMNFALKGKISYGDEPRIGFEMNSTNTDLAKAIQLLPNKIKEGFEGYEIDGKAEINGSIDGPLSAINQPAYHFKFAVENGRFEQKKNKLLFKNSFLKGEIHNGNANTPESSEIVLDNITTNFNGGEIQGTVSLKNFNHPQYRFDGKMSFKLKDATTLFKWDDLKEVKGSIDAKLHLSGSLEKLDSYTLSDWKRSKVNGEINLKGVGFYYRDGPQHIHQINGAFRLQNNSVNITSLQASVNESQLQLQGAFNNLIGYLVEENEVLMVDANLSSNSIRLEDFLAANASEKDTSVFQLKISPQLKIYLHTEIAALSFKKFELKNLTGDFVVNKQQIDGRSLTFQTLDGNASGDFFIRENAKNLNCYAQLSVQKIDIKKLFYSFDNFGQNTLMSDNIAGVATADIEYSSLWSKNLISDLKSLKVSSDLLIENGLLKNYKPLEKLSSYIALDELKEIKFNNLKNQILIKDETIIIPNFDVNSSALNIGIQGKHYFNNDIDYSFTLLLNEILGKKVRKPKSNEFGYIEDDGLGRTKIFVKMTGTIDNPKFSYDKQALKGHLKSEAENEKQTIKSLLNKEFGLFKKDSSIQKTKETKKGKSQPFKIEWEENAPPPTEEKPTAKSNKKEEKEKGKFGKFMDKIAKPDQDEYE